MVADACEVVALSSLHDQRFLGFGVIVSKQVQHPVHDEERQFGIERACMLSSLVMGNHRTQHDVTDQRQRIVRSVERVLIKGKRQHISGSGATHVFGVEIGDGVLIDEMQIDSTFANRFPYQDGNANATEHIERNQVVILSIEPGNAEAALGMQRIRKFSIRKFSIRKFGVGLVGHQRDSSNRV